MLRNNSLESHSKIFQSENCFCMKRFCIRHYFLIFGSISKTLPHFETKFSLVVSCSDKNNRVVERSKNQWYWYSFKPSYSWRILQNVQGLWYFIVRSIFEAVSWFQFRKSCWARRFDYHRKYSLSRNRLPATIPCSGCTHWFPTSSFFA